jgi:hypothetical protein
MSTTTRPENMNKKTAYGWAGFDARRAVETSGPTAFPRLNSEFWMPRTEPWQFLPHLSAYWLPRSKDVGCSLTWRGEEEKEGKEGNERWEGWGERRRGEGVKGGGGGGERRRGGR